MWGIVKPFSSLHESNNGDVHGNKNNDGDEEEDEEEEDGGGYGDKNDEDNEVVVMVMMKMKMLVTPIFKALCHVNPTHPMR